MADTRVVDIMKMHMSMPRFLRRIMLRHVMLNQHHYDVKLREAAQMAKEEFEKAKREVNMETGSS